MHIIQSSLKIAENFMYKHLVPIAMCIGSTKTRLPEIGPVTLEKLTFR